MARVHGRTGGLAYDTWHSQIGPVYWCPFGHEHGSAPARIPGAPLVPYGYVAAHAPQDEPEVGFKESIFPDDGGQYWVRFVVHAGTASQRRGCARHHTLYVQAYDNAGNERMAVNLEADYGVATATNDAGGGVLQPTICVYSMQTLAEQVSDRKRSIDVGADSNNYEQWDSRSDTQQTLPSSTRGRCVSTSNPRSRSASSRTQLRAGSSASLGTRGSSTTRATRSAAPAISIISRTCPNMNIEECPRTNQVGGSEQSGPGQGGQGRYCSEVAVSRAAASAFAASMFAVFSTGRA